MKIGIHGGSAGWTAQCHAVADALRAECYLWLADVHQPADAIPYDATHILRLPNPQPGEGYAAYANRVEVEAKARAWYDAPIPHGALLFVTGNEPDTTGYDLPVAWTVDAWLGSHAGYMSEMRARFPDIAFLAPPFTCANTKRITAAYVAPYDGISVHCYFAKDNPGWRQGIDGGAAWLMATPYKRPVWITEVNSNPSDAGEILAWIGEAHDQPLLAGCCLFIADGNASGFPQYDLTIAQAAAIRAGLVTPPEQPVNPYAYDGPYDFATWQRMLSGPLTDKNPSAASFVNYRAACAQGEAVGVSLPTLAGWIKSENVDPDLVAVNNLAGIKYVGQSRAYPSNVLPPANERGVYAGFATPDDFWYTLAVNIATIDPDAWQRGDLATIARTYTGGTQGLAKVTLVDALRDTNVYPHGVVTERDPGSGPAQRYRFIYPVDADIIQGSDGTFSHGGKSPGFFALDYGCAFGTPIRCVADGTVIYNGFNHPREGQTGHTICVEHPGGYESRYCHLSAYPAQVGDAVRQGEVIANSGAPDYPYPGANGYGSGAHLHFSISLNDVWVRCEDLMAAGLMGPYDASEEETDMHIDGKFDPGRLARLWDGPKTKAQIKTVGGYSDQRGIDARWLAELQAGKPVGFAISNEENIPTGGTIRYFSNGFICSYPDGSTTVC